MGRSNFQGGRGPGNQAGGFRIRLSDNEMRASRAIQEAFNLRSTVAVLGFATRTLGQMLEEGKLDQVINEYRSNSSRTNNNKNTSNRRTNKYDQQTEEPVKVNPFARPPKPESSSTQDSQEIEVETATPTTKVDETLTESSNEIPTEDPNNHDNPSASNS